MSRHPGAGLTRDKDVALLSFVMNGFFVLPSASYPQITDLHSPLEPQFGPSCLERLALVSELLITTGIVRRARIKKRPASQNLQVVLCAVVYADGELSLSWLRLVACLIRIIWSRYAYKNDKNCFTLRWRYALRCLWRWLVKR